MLILRSSLDEPDDDNEDISLALGRNLPSNTFCRKDIETLLSFREERTIVG